MNGEQITQAPQATITPCACYTPAHQSARCQRPCGGAGVAMPSSYLAVFSALRVFRTALSFCSGAGLRGLYCIFAHPAFLDAQVLAEAVAERLGARQGERTDLATSGNISPSDKGRTTDIAAAHAQGASIQAGIHGIAPLEPVTKSPVTSFGYH